MDSIWNSKYRTKKKCKKKESKGKGETEHL